MKYILKYVLISLDVDKMKEGVHLKVKGFASYTIIDIKLFV